MTKQNLPAALPDMPQGLTATWLSAVLGQDIQTVTLEQIGEGAGMMSEISRVHISYADPNHPGPKAIIAKYASQNPTNREVAMSFNLYERETRYFAELDEQTSAMSPATLLVQIEGDRFVILMDDLHDYHVGDQRVGATLAQTELAIDELAKLHGAFWQQVDHLDWIPGIADSYHADNMRNFSDAGWEQMISVFGEFIPPDIAQMKQMYMQALPALQAAMHTPPITLIHGDFRMENLLYGTQDDHTPIVIIDWQGPLLGWGMVDVCLLLGQSTQTSVRRQHERELLQRYHQGLANLDVAYPGDMWQDYRMAHLYNWVYVAVVCGALDTSNARAFAWMTQMVNRQVAATKDLDLLELLNVYS